MISFVKQKEAANPRQPGLLVRDRDLLGQLMLPLVLVCGRHVELGGVAIHEEFVVQRPVHGQADQRGGRGQRRRQARACPGLPRAIGGLHRRSNVVKIRRVVDLKSRFDDQGFVEHQRNPALIVDVARQPQIGPAIEHQEQLAAGRGHVIAAEGMVGMIEVANVAVLDAARERDRSHHLVANERAADVRASAKLREVPGRDIRGHLHVVGRRLG